jgi:hypothetical protein
MNNQITPIKNDNRVTDFIVEPAQSAPSQKSRVEYIYSCTNAMFNYLKHKDVGILVEHLMEVEFDAIRKEKEHIPQVGLYFKFGQDDPLTTTIADIRQTLKYGNQRDKDFLIEQFEKVISVINPDDELEVYFN